MKRAVCGILTCICFIGLLCGCDIQINMGSNEDETEKQTEAAQQRVDDTAWDEADFISYEVFSANPSNISVTSMTDGKKNYFYVKLGEIRKIPVFVDAAYYHDGRTEMDYRWENSLVTEEGFQSTTSHCVTTMTNASMKASVNASTEVGLKASYANVSAKVSTGLETTLGASYSQSSTQSSTNSINQMIKDSQSHTISISKDSPAGYYRYAVYGDMSVYAEIVCDLSSRQIAYSYVSVPIANSYVSGLWYSKDGSYGRSGSEQLALTEEILAGIDLFDDHIANKTEDYIYGQTEFWDPNRITVLQDGAYGLEQPHLTDTLNLSELTDFMTADYEFHFDITVKSECKRVLGIWIDGNHEIHLYNQYNEKVSKSAETVSEQIAREKYGLVCSKIWTQRNGENTFHWTVSGADCREKMYLCYDAHGEDDDTWYCNSMFITVTVMKKKA